MADRITSNYSEAQNRDVLFSEIEARRADGRNIPDINANSKREDMESALELDDESRADELEKEKRENAQVSAKATPEENTDLSLAHNIPESRNAGVEAEQSNIERPPLSAYKGSYTHKKDGDVYALAVVNDDPRGRTHKAMNKAKFWEGNADEFDATFSKD